MQDLQNHSLPSCIEKLPIFEASSNLTGLPNLRDNDIDEQFPVNIQSKYFTLSELASVEANANDLMILHTNIRSLSAHIDELVFLCGQFSKIVDIIGVSETWNSIQNEFLTNIDIEGYNFYNTKSLSQNGGAGLYVKKSLISTACENLSFRCNEFETVWVEVENANDKNYLFCCAYRHPNSDVDVFTSHLQSICRNWQTSKSLLWVILTLIFSTMMSMLQQTILLTVYFLTIFYHALITLLESQSIPQRS